MTADNPHSVKPIIEELEAERDLIWAALKSIAQYDERWIWPRTNDAPNRQQLIERAYDAVIRISFGHNP